MSLTIRCRCVDMITNKVWFRQQKLFDVIWMGRLVPCSIEGWIWTFFVMGVCFYFGSNFEAGTINIVGFILTVLVGITVSILKSE